MLRRGVLQIVRKKSLSSLPLYAKHLSTVDLSLCSTSKAEADKHQSIRRVSNTFNLSTQTKIMDGDGNRQIFNADYETLLDAQEKGELIIDVREQNEINETGKLPGSIHIPMGNVSNLLNTLSDQAFEKTFEKSKPTKDTKIILSCRSGMRSGKVQEELQKLGYENVYNYTGGWLEWESKQKV